MAFAPAGWPQLEAGIATWLAAARPAGASWGWADDSKRPELPVPYVLASFLGPPRHTFHAGHKAQYQLIEVRTAAVQNYTIRMLSGSVTYAAQLGDTTAIIRDALVALIPGSTAFGASSMLLPDTVRVTSDPVATYPAIVSKRLKRQESRGQCTLQVDCYAATDSLAFALCLAMEASLETHTHRETINSAGWGFVQIANSRSLPFYENGQWRGRAAFDVVLSCRYEIDEVIDYLESAAVQTLNSSGDALTGEVF